MTKWKSGDQAFIPRLAGSTLIPAIACLLIWSAPAAVAQGSDRSGDIKALGNCEGCVFDGDDFSGRRLMGLDLEAARLDGVAFDGASLGVAVFDGSDLTDVSFDHANLRGASFVGARLTAVTFGGADLHGAVFEGAILIGTDLLQGRRCSTQMPDDRMDNSDCR
jgi:uncharacterized protein YjbI with pentapeptide repeats